MGPGRRMKKQGPPPPLDESLITSLKKRKAGAVDADERGKKRKTIEKEKPIKLKAQKEDLSVKLTQLNAAKKTKSKTDKTPSRKEKLDPKGKVSKKSAAPQGLLDWDEFGDSDIPEH